MGGKLVRKGKITGGRLSGQGEVFYKNLPVAYSGPFHRAVLQQDAEAVDIRCIQVKEECHAIFEQIVGVPYKEVMLEGVFGKAVSERKIFDVSTLPADTDFEALSLALGRGLTDAGYRILWDPDLEKKM